MRPLLYSLAKLRFFVNNDTSVLIYKTYILPVLEFGLYLVDNVTLVEKLQKLQNKALRICLREVNTSPSYPLHCATNLLSLDMRRACTLMSFMNIKLLRGDDTFKMETRNDNRTRADVSGRKLCISFPRSERFKRSISFQGPSIWNGLPAVVKENLYPETFKMNVRKHYWVCFNDRKSVRKQR